MYKGAIEVAVLSGLKLLTKNKQKWKKKVKHKSYIVFGFLLLQHNQHIHTYIQRETFKSPFWSSFSWLICCMCCALCVYNTSTNARRVMVCWLFVWLVGWMVGRLVGTLVGWLVRLFVVIIGFATFLCEWRKANNR